jgi:hypothetical protein
MLALEVLLAVSLLMVCGFGSGFFLVRRLGWTPMEKLCGSIGASLIICYLVFVAAYLLGPKGTGVSGRALAGSSAGSAALLVLCRRDLVSLLHSTRVRQTLKGFSFLAVWTLLILTVIRNYSGANWFGDWLEHFQRSLFFLDRFPGDSPIVFGYQLPARPPAMNELAAFFLAQTRDRFEIFQVIFTLLNLLIFFPCCLIMPALAGRRRTYIWPLVLLFAASPAVMQQTTYPWTKAFTAFFVVLSFCLYLAGWRKNDSGRTVAAFLAAAMALLVHYSAGPYVVFLAMHYLLRVFWRGTWKRRLRELAAIAALSGALLATWFAWSISVYGVRTTLASNTSVTGSREYKGHFLAKTAQNLVYSMVPAAARFDPLTAGLAPEGALPALRDKLFVFYQPNLVFGMGIVGGPLIVWLLYGAFFRGARYGRERRFWLTMIPVCMVLGIGSTGEIDPRGLAHITLFSLQIMGLSLLAAVFPWRRALMPVILAGCLIDFSAGILLQAYVEGLENTPGRTVYAGLNPVGGKPTDSPTTAYSFGGVAWDNWYLKHQYALNREALDKLAGQEVGYGPVAKAKMQSALAEDEFYWHGWYSRNGGSVTLLGDHFAGSSDARAISKLYLLVVLLGLLMRAAATKNAALMDQRSRR